MDSSEYTPRLGFWMATIFVIIVTVFPLIFLGVFSGIVDASAAEILNNFGLLMIPSSCVALLQTLLLVSRSPQQRAQWFGITVAGIAIGWGIVFALSPLLGRLPVSSTISNQLVLAALQGFIAAAPMGVIVGLVTGIIQGRIQPLSARAWLVGNLISWSMGIGVPYALILAAFSQIRFF